MEIKVLEKTVTLGEKVFKVGTDRNIAVKAFEEHPELIEYLVNKQGAIGKSDDTAFFLEAIKNKELGMLFDMESKLADLIAFALPMMLEKAGDKSNAQEIISYAKENDADTMLNNGMLEFLVQGFTQRELAKPKIKFSMK